jgi:hypothetical protein
MSQRILIIVRVFEYEGSIIAIISHVKHVVERTIAAVVFAEFARSRATRDGLVLITKIAYE